MTGIFPLKGSAEPQEDFVVVDIENQENGNVICIGLTTRNSLRQIEHHVFDNWYIFLKYIMELRQCEDKYARIWAHNGGGWDWNSLFSFLLHNRTLFPALEIFPIIVQTKFVVLQLDFDVRYSKDEDGNLIRSCTSIRFCDSLFLLRSSLEELSQKFLGKGKVDTSGLMAWDLYRKDKVKFYLYLRGDCENLLLILEKFYETIREKIVPLDHLGNTIGSTSLRIYRTSYKSCIEIPTDENGQKKLRQFLREGYYGGRVEVFKYGHHPKVKVYDINSLYPFVMREHYYPINGETESLDTFRRGIPGIYRIIFDQENRSIPAVMMQRGKGIYQGEGVFFSPEIELLHKVGADIKVMEGYVFKNNRKIFTEYIQKMWDLRLSDYKGPLGLICKFLMNSLYGKFCERPKDCKLIILNGGVYENMKKILNWELSENKVREKAGKCPLKIEIVNEGEGVYQSVDGDAICNNEHVGIGGMITSWARVELYKRFLLTGAENLVYCDTDSIHTLGELDHGKELGDVKLECEGEGIYCGKKLYGLRWRRKKMEKKSLRKNLRRKVLVFAARKIHRLKNLSLHLIILWIYSMVMYSRQFSHNQQPRKKY